jgi:hypothetical protein
MNVYRHVHGGNNQITHFDAPPGGAAGGIVHELYCDARHYDALVVTAPPCRPDAPLGGRPLTAAGRASGARVAPAWLWTDAARPSPLDRNRATAIDRPSPRERRRASVGARASGRDRRRATVAARPSPRDRRRATVANDRRPATLRPTAHWITAFWHAAVSSRRHAPAHRSAARQPAAHLPAARQPAALHLRGR